MARYICQGTGEILDNKKKRCRNEEKKFTGFI
jgi:hypothetical protein